jgi:hypothetical protein
MHTSEAAPASSPPTVVFGVFLDAGVMQWPGRNQLMAALAKHTSVVILQASANIHEHLSIPTRPTIERLDEGLFLMRDAFSVRTHRIGKHFWKLSSKVDGRWFRRALNEAGLGDYLMWLTVNDPVLSQGTPAERLVYDCMDPNFLDNTQAEFDRSEFALAARAKVVFASAASLFARMQGANRNTYLLPNATAVDDAVNESEPPPPLRERIGPVVGYLGTIDWRFDADCVTYAASALPDVTFAIVGRVNADQEAKVARLRQLPNVVMPGQVGKVEGAAYTKAFDVGLIPFTPSAMNDAINPVKMYMYLASGIPVVSTWIAECRANPLVTAAETHDDFVQAIRNSLDQRDEVSVQSRKEFGRTNTWDHRARTAIEVLANNGLWS